MTIVKQLPEALHCTVKPACFCDLRHSHNLFPARVFSLFYFQPSWFYPYLIGKTLRRSDLNYGTPAGEVRLGRDRLINQKVSNKLLKSISGQPEVSLSLRRPGGKPYLRGNDHVQFNLSHSYNQSIFGAMPFTPVGVDIEEKNSAVHAISAAEAFLSEAEMAVLDRKPGEKATAALRMWTIKEAFSKVSGRGVYEDFPSLDFSEMAHGAGTMFYNGVYLSSLEIAGAYIAIAATGRYETIEIWRLCPKPCCIESGGF